MSDSDASSFAKDAPTWEEMQSNIEENPFELGTPAREKRREENEESASAERGGYAAETVRERSKQKNELEGIAGKAVGEAAPGIGARDRAQANINYRETGEVSAQPREGYRSREASEERAAQLDDEKHQRSLQDIDPSKVVGAAEKEKAEGDRPYDPSKEPEPYRPEPEYQVDERTRSGWNRTLRDLGVTGLSLTADALRAAEKQYGAVVKLTGQLEQGRPMSIPSQALTATMTGLGTMNELAEDAAEDLGIKPGVDPEKLRDQLAVKGPGYYEDKDKAKERTEFVIGTFNDAVERAAKGKDLSQLNDAELKQVYDEMERALRPDYDRIIATPEEKWTMADRAFYNAYVALDRGVGRRAKAIQAEQRSQMRGMKQQQKDLQSELDMRRGEWYRSGRMTDPKDVGAYKRELEAKMDSGIGLSPEEEEDYDDILMTYGWRSSVDTLGRDMMRKPHRVPLWTQKAGRKLLSNFGDEKAVLKMYLLARKGDKEALRSMIDTPEKRAAAMGFARMGLANQQNPVMREKYPMSGDDIVLSYAIESALSGKDVPSPVEAPDKFAIPKWMRDERAYKARIEAQKLAEERKKLDQKATDSPPTVQTPVETPEKEEKTAEIPAKIPKKRKKQPKIEPPALENEDVKEEMAEEEPAEAAETPQESPERISEGVLKVTARNAKDGKALKDQYKALSARIGTARDHRQRIRYHNDYAAALYEHALYTAEHNRAMYSDEDIAHIAQLRDRALAYSRKMVPLPRMRGQSPDVNAMVGRRRERTPPEPAQKPPADKQPEIQADDAPETPASIMEGYDSGLKSKEADGKVQMGFEDRLKSLTNLNQRDVLIQDIKAKAKDVTALRDRIAAEFPGDAEGAKWIQILNNNREDLDRVLRDVENWNVPKEPLKSKEKALDEKKEDEKAKKRAERNERTSKAGAKKLENGLTVNDIFESIRAQEGKDIGDFVAEIEKAYGRNLNSKEIAAYEKFYRQKVRDAKRELHNVKGENGEGTGKYIGFFDRDDEDDPMAKELKAIRGYGKN